MEEVQEEQIAQEEEQKFFASINPYCLSCTKKCKQSTKVEVVYCAKKQE